MVLLEVGEVNRRFITDNLPVVALVQFLTHVQLVAAERQKGRLEPIGGIDREQLQTTDKVHVPEVVVLPVLCRHKNRAVNNWAPINCQELNPALFKQFLDEDEGEDADFIAQSHPNHDS